MNYYRKRVFDDILKFRLKVFGAVLITGPKGCGKTRTASEIAKSKIEFQDEETREYYLSLANNFPSKLLDGEKPRLFDEWQDAPKLWGAIRKYCDDNVESNGMFILTGSSSNDVKTPHSGTLRITELEMLPMSLFETGESTGEISLLELFDHKDNFIPRESKLTIDDIIYSICRGGWPKALLENGEQEQLYIAKDLFNQTCKKDMSELDNIKRNPNWVRAILKSYARNICTVADSKTIFTDVNLNCGISESSFYEYVNALERLYIIEDISPWSPSLRSKSNVRSKPKRNLIDPSIAVAALGASPESLKNDFKTLGFLFESLVIRDLKAYSLKAGGELSFYRDRYDLEADAVLHLDDGRYALIEIKLSDEKIDEGAKHLNEIERLVEEFNNKYPQFKMRIPDLKIVITGTRFAFKRDDGVFVIPLGCIKD